MSNVTTDNIIKIEKQIIKTELKYVDESYPSSLPLDSIYKPHNRRFGMNLHPIYKRYKMHTGIDIAAPKGTPIKAVANGFVVKVEYKASGYGKNITIKHNKELSSLYAHCSKIIVNVGDYVNKGDTIALVGSTGTSTGNHLHFEIIETKNGITTKVNPDIYISSYKK